MYELIKMREGLRYLCVSVKELREVLCCEHTYDRFSDFKRYVLERARTEIKDTCDIYFTYKVERSGRTPEQVHFMIHRKDDPDHLPLIRESQNETFSEEGGSEEEATDSSDNRSPFGEAVSADEQLPDDVMVGTPEDPAHLSEEAPDSAVPDYNLYATVLGGLTQNELDELSTSTIESALNSARTQIQGSSPHDNGTSQNVAPVARMVARTALATLRGEDKKIASSDGPEER
jgi:hypothetical protein